MARTINSAPMKGKAKAASSKNQAAKRDDGADDAAILLPDLTFTLAGREVTIREYRFVDGLRARAKAKHLTVALHHQIIKGEALTEDILDVLATHGDVVRELVINATSGADADWYDGLGEEDGTQLLVAWWSVCGPFFLRQIASRLGQAMKLKEALVGLTSSMPSPGQDTAQPTS